MLYKVTTPENKEKNSKLTKHFFLCRILTFVMMVCWKIMSQARDVLGFFFKMKTSVRRILPKEKFKTLETQQKISKINLHLRKDNLISRLWWIKSIEIFHCSENTQISWEKFSLDPWVYIFKSQILAIEL